ncbi:MAG: hypothetical protein K6G03_09395 [Lachnospiraceae bacterium]|nr:hypothetical protein [Lachnospiraceae bacterium]
MEDGIAYIPCKVDSINDIISKYSIKGCESLDTEFFIFITGFIEFIPPQYPIVLEISGAKFSSEEKKVIIDTIMAEMDYLLGKTEETQFRIRRRFWSMIIGTIISGCVLGFANKIIQDAPLEFFYVIFWLFADALVRYLFIEKLDFKQEKLRMGRMASMKVEFVDRDEADNAEADNAETDNAEADNAEADNAEADNAETDN